MHLLSLIVAVYGGDADDWNISYHMSSTSAWFTLAILGSTILITLYKVARQYLNTGYS